MQSLMGETPKTALHRFLPTLQALSPTHPTPHTPHTPYSLLPTPYSLLPTPYLPNISK
ncbi:MAG: hypothetical protein F6K49_20010 [Moorea sp. SIO3I6]|nr:hypothetical protein [Moorena sp. SIO3I6]